MNSAVKCRANALLNDSFFTEWQLNISARIPAAAAEALTLVKKTEKEVLTGTEFRRINKARAVTLAVGVNTSLSVQLFTSDIYETENRNKRKRIMD